MVRSSRLYLIVAGLACTSFGAFAAAVYAVYFSRQPGQDWMVYYTAARAYLDGNLPLLFDGDRLTAYMNQYFADWLERPLSFHPWLYPPTYLLLLVPFGLLSFVASYVVFQLVTFAGLVGALWATVARGYRRWLHLLSLILAPAALFNLGSGQNAFLSTALLVGGFGTLARRPRLAGALLGVLAYKPQLALLVPVALIAARQWPALAAATVTACGMIALSVAVFGFEPWRVWLEWFIAAPPESYQAWVKWGRLQGESVYAVLCLAGASPAAAQLSQMVAALLAGACVFWSYQRSTDGELRLIVLLAATTIAAPHLTNYDAVMLVVAATLLFARGLEDGFRRGELTAALLVWMVQLFDPPAAFSWGLVTPVFTCALIACAMARMRQRSGSIGRRVPLSEARAQ